VAESVSHERVVARNRAGIGLKVPGAQAAPAGANRLLNERFIVKPNAPKDMYLFDSWVIVRA